MLHDGAVRIDHEDIDPIGVLAQKEANWFAVRRRIGAYAYPSYGQQARRPLVPNLQSREGFAALTDAGSSARWYPVWARKSFSGGETLRGDFLTDFYLLTFRLLTEHGLTEEIEGHRRTTFWVIKPDAVEVSSDAACLECGRCHGVFMCIPISYQIGLVCDALIRAVLPDACGRPHMPMSHLS